MPSAASFAASASREFRRGLVSRSSRGGALSAASIDARPPAETESLWEYFHRSDVDFWDSQSRLVTLVLVFDQFEERFTLGRQLADIDTQAEVSLRRRRIRSSQIDRVHSIS